MRQPTTTADEQAGQTPGFETAKMPYCVYAVWPQTVRRDMVAVEGAANRMRHGYKYQRPDESRAVDRELARRGIGRAGDAMRDPQALARQVGNRTFAAIVAAHSRPHATGGSAAQLQRQRTRVAAPAPPVPEAVRQRLAQGPPFALAESVAARGQFDTIRSRAASTPQLPTAASLQHGAASLWSPRPQQMDPRTLFGMREGPRAAWYVTQLGRFQNQLYDSARAHRIPMQLLACIILNELGDYSFGDWLQDTRLLGDSGSLGIAQIQVTTAVSDRLVDVPESEVWAAFWAGDERLDEARQRLTAERLRVPQFAIEAAAREIELLLTRMGQYRDRPWQQRFGFTGTGPEGEAIYGRITAAGARRETQRAGQEARLANMVAGAYNSPDVVITRDLARYVNADRHGENAAQTARELYQHGLFRTS